MKTKPVEISLAATMLLLSMLNSELATVHACTAKKLSRGQMED
jgi:hypothetical protein